MFFAGKKSVVGGKVLMLQMFTVVCLGLRSSFPKSVILCEVTDSVTEMNMMCSSLKITTYFNKIILKQQNLPQLIFMLVVPFLDSKSSL